MYASISEGPSRARDRAGLWAAKVSDLVMISRQTTSRDGTNFTTLTLDGKLVCPSQPGQLPLSKAESYDLAFTIMFAAADSHLPCLQDADREMRVRAMHRASAGLPTAYGRDLYYRASQLKVLGRSLPRSLTREAGQCKLGPGAATIFDIQNTTRPEAMSGPAHFQTHSYEGKAKHWNEHDGCDRIEHFVVKIDWSHDSDSAGIRDTYPASIPIVLTADERAGTNSASSTATVAGIPGTSSEPVVNRWRQKLSMLRFDTLSISLESGMTFKDLFHTGQFIDDQALSQGESKHLATSLMPLHANQHLPHIKQADREFEAEFRTRSRLRSVTADYWALNMAHAAGDLMSLGCSRIPRDLSIVDGLPHLGPAPAVVQSVQRLSPHRQSGSGISFGPCESYGGEITHGNGQKELYRVHLSWESPNGPIRPGV